MRNLITSKQPDGSVPSSITLFVALYLILLAFFIILTKDLSFDDYKQTIAMHSLHKTFGKPKTQEIYFGVIDEGKIDEFPAQLESIFKKNAEVIITPDSSRFTLQFSKNYLYFADEANFKPEILDEIIAMKDIIRRWHERDKPNFTINISLSDYQIDKKRLEYFKTDFKDIDFDIGISDDGKANFEIIVEKNEVRR